MTSLTSTTLPEDPSGSDVRSSGPPSLAMLALAWSADSPDRIGEILVLPGDVTTRVLGRGSAASDDPHPRVQLARHRPGTVTLCPPIASPHISRAQLHLCGAGPGRIEVKNVGKCRLLCNGEEVHHAEVGPGDTVELGGQLLFVCVERPAFLTGRVPGQEFPFGTADAHGIVGESAAAWALRQRIDFLAARPGHVLVRGETGTGKELVARALHGLSPRASRAIVARNAATFPEGLVDAELFGNIRGYPNPGVPERPGLVGEADGSTLFLDEFAELPMTLQAHLLRVLDSGEYHRLGDARARKADIRLVAATNRPESAVKHDLLARLVLRLEVPSLNDRREDIPLLVCALLARMTRGDDAIRDRFFERSAAAETPRLSPALVRALVRHVYALNVRELESLLWRSIAGSQGDRLDLTPDMPLDVPRGRAVSRAVAAAPAAPTPAQDAPEKEDVSPSTSPPEEDEELSRDAIQRALDAHNGSIEATWPALRLTSRHALARLIRKHGIEIRKKSR